MQVIREKQLAFRKVNIEIETDDEFETLFWMMEEYISKLDNKERMIYTVNKDLAREWIDKMREVEN